MKKIDKVENKKDNKFIIIGIIVIIIICIIMILIFSNKKEKLPIKINEVLDIVDYDNSKIIDTTKSDKNISNKYEISSNIIETKEDVILGDYVGKVLFVRSNINVNVFQIRNKIEVTEENNAPLLAQVNTYLSLFKKSALNYLGIDSNTLPKEEKIGSESLDKIKRPLREIIYKDNKLYTLTYEVEDNIYDINFYMDEGYLVCELIKFLNN